MTLEVSDCTASSVEFESDTPPLKPIQPAPKGLAAIADSIQIHPIPPKPNILERLVITLGLMFFHMVTWTVQFSNWVLKTFFGFSSRQKVLYRELHHIAKKGDTGEIKEFLVEHAEETHAAGYLFAEFVALPELYIYLPEIMEGANICLLNDHGFFCRRWSDHPDAYRRISSHEYQDKECYAIGHFLFWLDPEGNTRFQFEKSPLKGFFSSINHIIDYLHYKRDNEQQGVTGTSPFTEQFCLKVPVDPEEFISRKIDYL